LIVGYIHIIVDSNPNPDPIYWFENELACFLNQLFVWKSC